jgi:plastocyanin
VPTATSLPVTSTPVPPSPTPAASAPGPAIISSRIEDFTFEDLEVSVGTIVSWFNKDGVKHTVTAGSFDEPQPAVFNSGALSKGEQYSFVFHEAGSFQFYCVFHPRQMVGTITVVDRR